MPPVTPWLRMRRTSSDPGDGVGVGPRVAAARRPRLAEAEGVLDARVHLEGRWHRLVAGKPRRREGQHLACGDVELVDVVTVLGVGQTLAAQHEHVGPGDRADDVLGAPLPVIDPPGHPRARLAVAEAHDPLVDHPDRALETLDAAQHVGAAVGYRHEVGHAHGAGGRAVHGLEHERPVDVAPRRDGVVVRRPEQPAAVLRGAEQGREARGRVETRQAQPVDGPPPAHERGRAQVAQHGILLDRRGHGVEAHAP
jgi:hypothetical protein